MSRPKVPHCKTCPHLDSYSLTWNVMVSDRLRHFCRLKDDRHITGQEVRTSPFWCPRRIGFSERYRQGFEK